MTHMDRIVEMMMEDARGLGSPRAVKAARDLLRSVRRFKRQRRKARQGYDMDKAGEDTDIALPLA